MTQLQELSSSQINRVYEIIELLQTKTNRAQHYFELITNSQQCQLTKIAFDNMQITEMQKIVEQLTSFRKGFSFQDLNIIDMQIRRCKDRKIVALGQQIQKRLVEKINTKKKEINKNYLYIFIQLVSAIMLIVIDKDMFTFLRHCDEYQCHIHTKFIVNTYWAGFPKDIASEEIQCETQLGLRSFKNRLFIRFVQLAYPYFGILTVFFIFLAVCQRIKKSQQLRKERDETQMKIDEYKRITQGDVSRLRLLKTMTKNQVVD